MSPNRVTKMLARRFMVSWRQQRTRYDIEALQANIERVGLVIRVRWALVAALSIYSILAAWAYTLETPWVEIWANMRIPALAFVFVLAYNTFYQLTYRRLGNIAVLNHAQLLFDAIVVTVLVYYSGGVHSWFWAMYSLFILEAAFILPKRWHAWPIAAFCAAAVGAVIWGDYFGVLPHIAMPYISGDLHSNLTFVAVRYGWQITVLAGTATVATLMTGALRRREEELAAVSIVDEKTGLYDRSYFLRALARELVRAERDDHSLSVLIVDVDNFDRFNQLFGIEKGDRMLRDAARAMCDAINASSASSAREATVVSRFGGEEFAILLAEDASGKSISAEETGLIAEQIRIAVSRVRVDDACVTVSIGISRRPDDGLTAEELIDAADAALTEAAGAGGNRVASASAPAVSA